MFDADVEIAIVRSPRGWEQPLVRYVTDHGGARVRVATTDRARLYDERYAVAVIDESASLLDADFVATLRQLGREILGVHDPDWPEGKQTLTDLGITAIIDHVAGPAEFVAAIHALAGQAATTDAVEADASAARPVASEAPAGTAKGWVSVVGGPSGGCGVTELAIAIAAAAAGRGEAVVVVDADDNQPGLAARLGLEVYPNIRLAIDAVRQHRGFVTDALVAVPDGGFEAMAGLSTARDWAELRPSDVREVVARLASIRQHVVVNVGNRVEDLPAVAGPARYGLARAMLAAADVLVGVAEASPQGVIRLLEWVADVKAVAAAPIHVVLNKAPVPSFRRGELVAELTRTYTPASLSFVPYDPKVYAAAWDGRPVPPAAAFSKAASEVCARTLPRGVLPNGRRRRWPPRRPPW